MLLLGPPWFLGALLLPGLDSSRTPKGVGPQNCSLVVSAAFLLTETWLWPSPLALLKGSLAHLLSSQKGKSLVDLLKVRSYVSPAPELIVSVLPSNMVPVGPVGLSNCHAYLLRPLAS